jgi:hypothetical protein
MLAQVALNPSSTIPNLGASGAIAAAGQVPISVAGKVLDAKLPVTRPLPNCEWSAKCLMGLMAFSISGPKAHKNTIFPKMCDQLPCMNMAVRIVTPAVDTRGRHAYGFAQG